MPAYQTSNQSYQGQGQFAYQTAAAAASQAPTGGSRWYGYCPTPEEKKNLKAQIVKVVEEKKAIERKLSFAPSRQDLHFLVERLTELQKRLDALVAEFVYMMECVRYYERIASEEEEEFLLFISANL